MPPELLGPVGLTVALGIALAVLWRDHLRSDADDRAQRDGAIERLKALDAAVNRLAAAVERDSRDRAQRHRTEDSR